METQINQEKILYYVHTYWMDVLTILPKVLGHPLLMKGLTTLDISMSTNPSV